MSSPGEPADARAGETRPDVPAEPATPPAALEAPLPVDAPASVASVPEQAASWELDLAAATLQADTSDVDGFFEALGNKLVRILGRRAVVQREGGLRRNKRVVRIVVDTAAGRLEAERARTGPVFYAVHAVRGITLQTTEIGAEQWLERLVALVRDEAARSSEVRAALGRTLDTY